ncbi:hypothetical protein PR202_gb05827 [Eleusine coracana subsp. coracana]|uniref:F-box domain-containing protein n=1 Tax=Eleusine coracana subsp. coracana TaxID=191504 RepID=A0AAV5E8X5_ELECO|nr:hypothetical protein QOZ80_1BG0070700 [Eleusine coracana subsp. coracana]GJN18646.1 hypothetical protein PR202_gb05827 [Eleusine coracana subsp. coracana]
MACSGELPPEKRRRISATAPHAFHCLPCPLEINILQSLPSLVSLVRAASTCRRWRDLASDPGFRRRFRTNHPPPVLGLFFSPPNDAIPAIPSFAPVRRDDADLAKVVLSGDFLLTPLYVGPRVAPPCWFVADSRSGRLLLFNWQAMHLALLNPLEKRVEGYFDFSELDLMDGGPQDQFLEPRLICFDEFPSRFWIFFLRHDQRRVQVGMFTDTMREGMLLPWLDAPERPNPNPNEQRDDWLEDGMVAGVFIYWFYKNYRHAIILDTTTEGLRCYAEEVPPAVYGEGAAYCVLGEDVAATEDPHACSPRIVYVHRNMIHRLTGGAPGSLAAPLLRDVVKDLGPDIESLFVDLHMQLPEVGNRFTIFGLRDGFVYFTTSHPVVQNVATWFCSLSLETGQVEKLLCRTYDARFQPYTMPWPRFLLGDPDDDNDSGIGGPSDSSKGNNERRQDGPAFSKKNGRSSTWSNL